jgi:GWxTD domain-containing protein
MSPRCWLVLIGCLGFSVSAYTSDKTKEPVDPMQIYVDFARYRGDENSLYVEVYYSIPQRCVTYRADSAGLGALIDITLLVTRKDSLVYGDRWLVPHRMSDSTEVHSAMNLVGVTGLSLTEGDYQLKVLARDRFDMARAESVITQVPVKNLEKDRMILSDLELASVIRQGDRSSPFFKNTLEVVPNVQGMYTEDQTCYFYAEAYNLFADKTSDAYYVRTVVYDAVGRELISRERMRKRFGESSVVVDNVPAAKLRTGTYTMVVALLDSAKSAVSSSGKKFFVYNATLGVDSALLAGGGRLIVNEYEGMNEKDLDAEFDYARYVASETERDQFKQLQGVDSKGKFLSEFWHRRGLGLKEEYLKRVAYANDHFRVLGREGYRADRGRVYIIYGPPDDYDRHPSESETRPYEIWTYNSIQGGVLFVFVQRSTGGDHELVHSTHRNELHDENWQRFALTR